MFCGGDAGSGEGRGPSTEKTEMKLYTHRIVLLAVLSLVFASGFATLAATSLGELRAPGPLAKNPERADADALQLTNPALVETEDEAVFALFKNGRTLQIAPNSSVFLEADSSGTIGVSVRRGMASITDPFGRQFEGGKNSYFHLTPAKRLPTPETEETGSVDPQLIELSDEANRRGRIDRARPTRER